MPKTKKKQAKKQTIDEFFEERKRDDIGRFMRIPGEGADVFPRIKKKIKHTKRWM